MNPLAPRIVPLLLLLGVIARCPRNPSPTDARSEVSSVDGALVDPTLELGTGQSYFETLAERGSRVELIHGPQGGYHLFARLRFQHLGPDVYASFRVVPLSGGDPINTVTERIRMAEGRGLVREGNGWASSNAVLVILTAIRGPTEVVGRRFRWELALRPAGSDQSATVAHEITVVDED